MSKKYILVFCFTVVLLLNGCSNDSPLPQQPETTASNAVQDSTIENETDAPIDAGGVGAEASTTDNAGAVQGTNSYDSNILIAYFTVPETDGVDAVSSASRVVVDNEVLGNTQYIAQLIEEAVGGELFAIETVQDYPGVHNPLLDFAYNEKAEGSRPELATQIENLNDYNIVFIGYPNWNADLPMPLYTFLEEYDFSEKTIIPFTTHGGSGLSRTISTIAELQPNAEVLSNGLSISRNNLAQAQNEVSAWIQNLGLRE